MSHNIAPTQSVEEAFLLKLKTDTASLHQQLERSSLSVALMSPDITREDYCRYLAAMREVVAWYESDIFPKAEAVDAIDKRRKLAAIDRDLAALSVAPLTSPSFVSPGSTAQAMGFMYVMEGSTLGGMVILKHLQGRSFISDDTTNFFNVYGRNTGTYWRDFIKMLSQYAVSLQVEDDVIAGAKAAFRLIDEYFASVNKG